MKVCILADPGNADGTLGGAELTMREFAANAPEDVELVDSLDCEAVVLGNCVTYGPDLVKHLEGKRVVRYHNDLARHENVLLREWLEGHATHVFTSPLHRDLYGLEGECIPPAIDLQAFRPNRQLRRNGHRAGTVAIAPWQNTGKGQQLLMEWSERNGPVDVYGGGPFAPHGPNLNVKGPLEPEQVAQTLWHYERFIHLPTDPEPFGRAVVEAWAAGCKLVVNKLVGALHFIQNDTEALENASQRFWWLVMTVLDSGRGK